MENPTESFEVKKKKMISWINKKTEGKEGFTAIHLAAFTGNLSIIRFLEIHGGDIYADNNYNLNALHVAAQGNQPAAVVYFLDKNVDINCRDKVKSTPLHWACYAGAENSV
jgi:ankyrin repeat protein